MDHAIMAALAGVAVGSRAPWLFTALARVLKGSTAADAARAESEAQRQVVRVSDLEDLIDMLRKALDRHLIRESAIASACELLIALASMVPNPTQAMLRLRDRAQQLLEDARARTSSTSGGK